MCVHTTILHYKLHNTNSHLWSFLTSLSSDISNNLYQCINFKFTCETHLFVIWLLYHPIISFLTFSNLRSCLLQFFYFLFFNIRTNLFLFNKLLTHFLTLTLPTIFSNLSSYRQQEQKLLSLTLSIGCQT